MKDAVEAGPVTVERDHSLAMYYTLRDVIDAFHRIGRRADRAKVRAAITALWGPDPDISATTATSQRQVPATPAIPAPPPVAVVAETTPVPVAAVAAIRQLDPRWALLTPLPASAEYRGPCAICGRSIVAGSMILWMQREGGAHVACGKPTTVTSTATTAGETTRVVGQVPPSQLLEWE